MVNNDLSAIDIRALQQALTPKMNKYIPIEPTAKQTAALLMSGQREMLYGGAARAGVNRYFYLLLHYSM